jgi:hypothetical protein
VKFAFGFAELACGSVPASFSLVHLPLASSQQMAQIFNPCFIFCSVLLDEQKK